MITNLRGFTKEESQFIEEKANEFYTRSHWYDRLTMWRTNDGKIRIGLGCVSMYHKDTYLGYLVRHEWDDFWEFKDSV